MSPSYNQALQSVNECKEPYKTTPLKCKQTQKTVICNGMPNYDEFPSRFSSGGVGTRRLVEAILLVRLSLLTSRRGGARPGEEDCPTGEDASELRLVAREWNDKRPRE